MASLFTVDEKCPGQSLGSLGGSTSLAGYKQDGGWDGDLGIKETGSRISKGFEA